MWKLSSWNQLLLTFLNLQFVENFSSLPQAFQTLYYFVTSTISFSKSIGTLELLIWDHTYKSTFRGQMRWDLITSQLLVLWKVWSSKEWRMHMVSLGRLSYFKGYWVGMDKVLEQREPVPGNDKENWGNRHTGIWKIGGRREGVGEEKEEGKKNE